MQEREHKPAVSEEGRLLESFWKREKVKKTWHDFREAAAVGFRVCRSGTHRRIDCSCHVNVSSYREALGIMLHYYSSGDCDSIKHDDYAFGRSYTLPRMGFAGWRACVLEVMVLRSASNLCNDTPSIKLPRFSVPWLADGVA